MAKDPAVLWYWNDWHGGTITFSRHLKGCYMDLLYAQFNNGHLSLEEIRTVLGTDFSHWDTLRKKFAQDAAGKFFNETLERKMVERKEYSQKQSERVKKRWDKNKSGNTTVLPKKEIVNETEDEIKTGNEILTHPFTSDSWLTTWSLWLSYRKKIKKPYKTFESQQAQLKWFADKNYTEKESIEIIQNSMRNSWQGLFEINDQNKNGKHHNTTEDILREVKRVTGGGIH